MNQNDEFEFKPLTKGLGFHPKKEVVASTPTPTFKTTPISSMTASISPASSMTRSALNLNTPLPRPEQRRAPLPSASNQAVENILKDLNEKNKKMQFQDKNQNLSPYLQTAPSLSAGFLDLLLITSLSLLYLMSLIFTLKIDLIKSVTEGGLSVWLSTAAVFVVVGFVYSVTQRMFVGFTLGEWAYEQRLGLPEEMNKATYSLKVVARQILIIISGIILIPLISWAMGRDIAGVTGLCTYRKR